jgi:hypothetical protein
VGAAVAKLCASPSAAETIEGGHHLSQAPALKLLVTTAIIVALGLVAAFAFAHGLDHSVAGLNNYSLVNT